MITAAATATDFDRWERHAATCDAMSLAFIIQDCQQAAQGMRNWNPSREGYYIDQALTYAKERQSRRQK